MRCLNLLLLPFLLAPGLCAQTTARAVYDELLAFKANPGKGGDPAVRAGELLAAHAELLKAGDGLYYRARIQEIARVAWQDVLASYQAHVAAAPESPLASESRVLGGHLLMYSGEDWRAAKTFLAEVRPDQIAGSTKSMHESLLIAIGTEEAHEALIGKEAPDFAALKVINGPESFRLSEHRGKVVLLDFSASWCAPCRALIPSLVKLQEEHRKDGLVVFCVTRFYGHGVDFADGATSGKVVGGGKEKLSEAEETVVNEHLAKSFALTYPLLIAAREVSGKQYSIFGIPAAFVIDREGKVTGSVVGTNHKRIKDLVQKALAQEPAGTKERPGKG